MQSLMPSHYHCFELNQIFIAAVCHMINQWLSLRDLPLDCKTQCARCGFRNVFGQSQSFLCSRLQYLFSTDFMLFSYLFFSTSSDHLSATLSERRSSKG